MSNSTLFQLNILNRVATLPIVNSAIEYATDTYSRIKNYNGLVNATLSRAEQSILYVAITAKPVFDKFEKPISAADSIACQGFDKLQNTIPALNKSTEEIRVESKRLFDSGVSQIVRIRQYFSETKQFGVNTVTTVLESTYFKALIRSVDTAIELTENTIDHYLPAGENESHNNDITKNDTTTLVRMGHLSDKMRRRVYDQLLSKWLPFIFSTIANLKSSVIAWNSNIGANPSNASQ